MTTFISPSELAHLLGIKRGEKKEFKVNLEGFEDCGDDFKDVKVIITDVIISEGRKGHTTLKMYGYKFFKQENLKKWETNKCEIGWRYCSNETMANLQNLILNK